MAIEIVLGNMGDYKDSLRSTSGFMDIAIV